MTNQYVKGKYTADGRFDENAVSNQVGAAACLKMLETKYDVDLTNIKLPLIENVVVTTSLPIIREGDVGRLVRILQFNLNKLDDHSLLVDGVFGPLTKESLIKFQDTEDLLVDGIVGRQVWGRIAEKQDSESPLA